MNCFHCRKTFDPQKDDFIEINFYKTQLLIELDEKK